MEVLITILLWVLTALCVIAGGLILYTTWHYGSLEKLGIPVVKPFLFLGSNYREAYVDLHQLDIDRRREYGDVYGVYDGRKRQIYISNPKLIRGITTADFDHFVNHGWDVGSDTTSIFQNLLDFLTDEKWKTVRAALTPIFTVGKIKQLTKVVQSIGEDYAENLLSRCESAGGRVSKIQFREFGAPMIIEMLGKCFCGIQIPNAKDPNNEFMGNMKLALWHESPIQEDWRMLVPKILPFVTHLAPSMEIGGMDFFVSAMKNILETREKSDEVSIDATSTLVDMMKKVKTDPLYAQLGIRENVVIAQAWEFFAAGYVGIRDLFDFFMYEMAANPEIQEQVYSEIRPGVKDDQESSELPYLSACLQEAARLHPVFTRPERLCNKDWKHEDLFIPKGTQVVFPIAALHMDPQLFPNPDTFDPNRFLGRGSKERDPYTIMTFGHGPRGCIGQRFSVESLKVMIVSFLRRFRVEKRSDTIFQRNPGGSFMQTFKPLYLDVVKR